MPNKKKPGLYHTKHGQPYRILKNGKARFVKKTKSTRRKKGGSASVGGSARVGGGLKRRRKGGGLIGDVGRQAKSSFNYFVGDTLR